MNKRRKNEKLISIKEARERRRERRALQRSKRNTTPKRKNRLFAYRKFYVLAVLILLVTAGVHAVRIVGLKADEARATAKFEAAQDKKARLESELAHINDPAYIEQQVRTRLRMIKPGEIYYVLPERADDGEETAAGAPGMNAGDTGEEANAE
jgi:cell division protein FtsB